MHVSLDFIIEVLVRLSVKSLCRFKCVSKEWCSLISDPRFARRHVDLAMIDKNVQHERRKLVLVAAKDIEHKSLWELSISSLSSLYHVECEAVTSKYVVAVKLDIPLIKSSDDKVEFIGWFNGLLCVCLLPHNIFLFNPATKELKGIPSSNINFHTSFFDRKFRHTIYGFGYDHSSDDYNIVKIIFEFVVDVYSLKTNTRRRAQSFPYMTLNPDPGVFLNGANHWVFAQRKVSYLESIQLIVAFYFVKGKFREMPRPFFNAANDKIGDGLGVLGGCLCLLTCNTATRQKDFWVMKEYGVKESWAKVFANSLLIQRPLGYLKNGEAMLDASISLVIYNPSEQTKREIEIQGIHGRVSNIGGTYVESLVSPHNLWN